MRQIEQFPVSIIEALPDRRSVHQESVERLAESIKTIGLRTPITVRIVDDIVCADGQKADSVPVLVTGAHRLAAVKQLGWDKIECYLFHPEEGDHGDDQITAKLWEISENLHRAELSTLERAEQIAEWVRLSEEREKLAQVAPVSKRGVTEGRGNSGGLRNASRELGLDRDKVRRSVKIASLPEEAKRVAESLGLSDNQSALERAALSENPVASLEAFAENKKLRQITPDELPRWKSIRIESARTAVRDLLRIFTEDDILDALRQERSGAA